MTIDEMLALIPPMDIWQRRALSISFASGNVMCMGSAVGPEYDEWQLRRYAAHAWDARHGTLIEMEAE